MAKKRSAQRATPRPKKIKPPDLSTLLVARLHQQRDTGGEYPLPLARLGAFVDPSATPAQLKKAKNSKVFKQAALALSGNQEHFLQVPVALIADAERLVDPSLSVEVLLQIKRKPKTHIHGVGTLKMAVTKKLQPAFMAALAEALAQQRLPATVGWLLDRGKEKLFLTADLRPQHGRPQTATETPVAALPAESLPSPPVAPPEAPPWHADHPPHDFITRFAQVFDRLDAESGRRNLVNLASLRAALPDWPRERFDRELFDLRRAGRFSLSSAELRHGLTDAERAAAIEELGTLYLFVSRRH